MIQFNMQPMKGCDYMGVRQMPGADASGSPQFAGMGFGSGGSGGGGGLPATTSTLGSVIVGNGVDITVEGLLSFSRKFGSEFDTGLKTHDNKTIYGVYYTYAVHISTGDNSASMGEIAGRTSNIVDIFGYVEDASEHNRYKVNNWWMYGNHSVVLKFTSPSSGDGNFNLLVLYTKN